MSLKKLICSWENKKYQGNCRRQKKAEGWTQEKLQITTEVTSEADESVRATPRSADWVGMARTWTAARTLHHGDRMEDGHNSSGGRHKVSEAEGQDHSDLGATANARDLTRPPSTI